MPPFRGLTARGWTCSRYYAAPSVQSIDTATLTGAPLDASKLTVERTTSPRAIVPAKDLIFGRNFTDHMLSIEWTASEGWRAPKITPYQNLSLDPACSVFHYAFCAFEGMKAYRDSKGTVRLFRPDRNMVRMNRSAARIALPAFDGDEFIELMKRFVVLEDRFLPSMRGFALYLRPTIIGTQATLGVGPPGSALLYLIASPVGPYYPTGFKAVSLEATSYAVRAWPGGFGDNKLGANYAPCIVPQIAAANKGLQQNLWLLGPEEHVTEVGTMNFFAAYRRKEDGQRVLVTPSLDGTILRGVIRDSVLTLARERLASQGWQVQEAKITMAELAEAAAEGRLMEAFGTGTAVVVSPIRDITWRDQKINCGLSPDQEAGPLAQQMKDWIEGIQYGDIEHPWSVKAA